MLCNNVYVHINYYYYYYYYYFIENTGIQDTGIEINAHYLLLLLNITNVLINCLSTYLTFIIIIIIPVNTTKS